MKTDMSAYGVTELTADEAFATSGGSWAILGIVGGVIGIGLIAGAYIADVILRHQHH
ncbi:hypothetical protein [Bradyrhizobium tunisiense]|uniref:hypothetical protein n=1 Tax=Bradyrhizobium tunisiense TaxID=3278709 RepID=UPI0035D716A2